MQKYNYISISLDGAAGSGKSTTAQAICQKYNYIHVDTGLHYRALSLFFLNKNILPELVPQYLLSDTVNLTSQLDEFTVKLFVEGTYFSKKELRNERMNKEVSYYARIPEVRSLLLKYQRGLVKYGLDQGFSGIIMDGRDIGSVVLPNANLKVFLHAEIDVRQGRRLSDGERDSISKRDNIDSTRKVAPLMCPDGALSINTGILSVDEVVSVISNHISSLS
ncbi:(d)CMP kinase [Opitutales bacterium]|nr:(d)CMP kinase [Opitutales bacterium]